MKTAEKIKKYCFIGVAGQKCISVDQALAFLAEHDKEIIGWIDEMTKRNRSELNKDEPQSILQIARWQEQIDVLTELKEKIKK